MGLLGRFFDEAVRDVSALGGFAFSGLMFFVLGLWSYVNRGNFTWLVIYFGGHVALVVVTIVMRIVHFKDRPQRMIHHTFLEKIEASSFPSLHAARGMFCALVVGGILGGVGWYVLMGFVGSVVGISRVVLRKHDVVDVVFGLMLGVGVFVGLYYLVF